MPSAGAVKRLAQLLQGRPSLSSPAAHPSASSIPLQHAGARPPLSPCPTCMNEYCIKEESVSDEWGRVIIFNNYLYNYLIWP